MKGQRFSREVSAAPLHSYASSSATLLAYKRLTDCLSQPPISLNDCLFALSLTRVGLYF